MSESKESFPGYVFEKVVIALPYLMVGEGNALASARLAVVQAGMWPPTNEATPARELFNACLRMAEIEGDLSYEQSVDFAKALLRLYSYLDAEHRRLNPQFYA